MFAWASLTVNPPTEFVLTPVEDLIGSVERVRLQTATKQERPATVVVLTGVVHAKRDLEVVDFTIERQELAIGIQTPDESPAWKTVSLKEAEKVLGEAPSQQTDTAPQPDPGVRWAHRRRTAPAAALKLSFSRTRECPYFTDAAAFFTKRSSQVFVGSMVAAAISLSNCLRKAMERCWLSALTTPSRE